MNPVLSSVKSLVAEDILAVDCALADALDSKFDLVPQIYRHALADGGKKVRPALVILCARLFAGDGYAKLAATGAVTHFATAAEMVHVASMIHDDVADLSTMRRGRETANAIWRNKMCVFVADFLFASVYANLSRPEYAHLLRRLSTTVNRMCEGEILQAVCEGNLDTTEEQYRETINLKTASLMGTCACIGAELGGASSAEAAQVATYGECLGAAFQIADDVLDLTGSAEEMGKSPGDDLKAGRVTLPVIYAIQALPEPQATALRRNLATGAELTPADVERMISTIIGSGALARAERVADELASQAKEALSGLPKNDAREALEYLVDFAVLRRN